ncbi:hypothetical protein F2Q69_00034671 [Brassica cretica]|uniref:Uncharacterized protein n=1 Tax=Brassica cretica TaxID=69181 RepID=A0A8S9SUV6_BRACR|nr:hypothetical protein F2Q69_00034671 [Brassica cretica]
MPMTGKFFSMAATERYKDLRSRKCIPQQCISLTDDNLSDVRRIVTGAILIHTLTDIDPYQPNVVREFIANLPEAEEQDDGVAVYVRGSLVDFSPSLINSLYCIPGFEEDPLQGNDIKAGRGSGADSSDASLEEGINRTIAGLKAIRVRLRKGDYVQYVPHPAFDEDEEED